MADPDAIGSRIARLAKDGRRAFPRGKSSSFVEDKLQDGGPAAGATAQPAGLELKTGRRESHKKTLWLWETGRLRESCT